MNILLLGEKCNLINNILLSKGHNTNICTDKVSIENTSYFDFIISFGYRYIISKDIIDIFPNKIINLHISLLPYNRGADPNLWSYLEDTPKGVTIHYIDENLDTGNIIVQKEIKDNIQHDTLKTSYDRLINEIIILFENNIDNILNGNIKSFPQSYKVNGGGELHKLKDKDKYLFLLQSKQWDTPVIELKGVAKKVQS